MAVYIHTISGRASLRYSPSSLEFGGWGHGAILAEDQLEIRLAAESNPPPKQRHQDVIEQIQRNVRTLRAEIEAGNSALIALIEPELDKRKRQCAEIENRRAEL
ncbi:MAG TPA: hypothetical protein VGD01_10000 [Candidatus Elarobacter sp.]